MALGIGAETVPLSEVAEHGCSYTNSDHSFWGLFERSMIIFCGPW